MIPELGHVALILALQLALLQCVFGLAGASRDNPTWIGMARGAAGGQLLFIGIGFLALVGSFLANDVSVLSVAEQHLSRFLPVEDRITAAWGSHEGSVLLWALLLSVWTMALVIVGRKLPVELYARVIGVMGLLGFCFLAYLLFAANPFIRLDPMLATASDPISLQPDPGSIFHSPLLYLGSAGFALVYAFAIAARVPGKLDTTWARWARPWALMAWIFLTLGITLGSWWGYHELGKGGWWFWSASETAALISWLAGAALLHSLLIAEQRDLLRGWTFFLALAAFALALIGTFLVSPGLLASVQAFALDPLHGSSILVFLGILVGASLILFARRAEVITTAGKFARVSREAALLTGSVLLLAALTTLLLGTLSPLLLEIFGLDRISVDPVVFHVGFVLLMAPALLLLGVAPWMRWGQENLAELLPRLRWQAAAAVLIGLVLPFAFGDWSWQAALALALAAWLLLATVSGLIARRRAVGALPLRAYGMGCAHIGLAIGVIGIGLVSVYQSEKTVVMHQGDSASLGPYEFVFRGAEEVPAAQSLALRGDVLLKREGRQVAILAPESHIHRLSNNIRTKAAIRYGVFADVYVAIDEPTPDGGWNMRLYLKPFLGWLWVGALLMVFGGLLTVLGKRNKGARQ